MFYTYVLKEKNRDHFYVGYTNNLKRRFSEHQSNKNKSTRGRLWKIYCYFVFSDRIIAENFESYLKTGSGRAFIKKHFKINSLLVESTEL